MSAEREQPDASSPSRAAAGPLVFLWLLGLTCALRFPALVSSPFCIDESYHAAGAAELVSGSAFYRDVVDHRPPGIYLIYRLAGVYNQDRGARGARARLRADRLLRGPDHPGALRWPRRALGRYPIRRGQRGRVLRQQLPFEAKLANGTLKTLFFVAIDACSSAGCWPASRGGAVHRRRRHRGAQRRTQARRCPPRRERPRPCRLGRPARHSVRKT